MKAKFAIIFIVFIHTISYGQWVSHGAPKGGRAMYSIQVDDFLFRASFNSVYRSIDSGQTWQTFGVGLPCNEVIYDFKAYENKLYAALSRNGIYVSEDFGESWTPLSNKLASLTLYNMSFIDDHIYASWSEGGYYHSEDLGQTWKFSKITNVNDGGILDFISFQSRLYAAVHALGEEKSGLYESIDNGKTWIKKVIPGFGKNGPLDLEVIGDNFLVSSRGGVFVSFDELNSWEFKPFDNLGATVFSFDIEQNTVYANTSLGTYFYSIDNGVNWVKVKNTQTDDSISFIKNIEGFLHMGTSKGTYVSSDNGITWTFKKTNAIDIEINSIKEFSGNLYSVSSLGILKSIDDGNSWHDITNGISTINYDITDSGKNLVLANYEGIFISENEGENWSKKMDLGPNEPASTIDSDESIVATAVTGKGVYTSFNNGETWTLMKNEGLPMNTSFTKIFVHGNSIVLGTHTPEVYLSEDSGNTWKNISFNEPKLINSFKLIDGILYVSTFQGIMTSSNLGKSWEQFDSYNYATYDVDIEGGNIYIGTDQGVFVADLNDRVFYPFCEGLGKIVSTQIHIKSGIIFAGTWRKSIWKRGVTESVPPSEDKSTLGIETIELCPQQGTINLFEKFGYLKTSKGIWYPELSANNGDFNPEVDEGGQYIFKFEDEICGCKNYLRFEVKVTDASAGEDTELFICTSEPHIDLLNKLSGNPSSNGVWNPSFKSGTNVFNPAEDIAGVYTYTVQSSDCGTSSSTVKINLIETPDAGFGNSLEICANASPINLFDSLNGIPDAGGNWNPALKSGQHIFNPAEDNSGSYTYTVGNGSCEKSATINIHVLETPSAGGDGKAIVCNTINNIDLTDYLQGSPMKGGSWFPELKSGTNMFDPKQDTAGMYTYTVTTPCGIESANVSVDIIETFKNTDINISTRQLSGRNEIELILDPSVDYEFSLDNINFQKSSVFKDLIGGIYQIYGREIGGCGVFFRQVPLIDYPRFFTPNNDGFNDKWQLLGVDNIPNYKIYIFDRFGKILAILNEKKTYWDGTFNGQILASTDYWFKADLGDGMLFQGHFSLIR